MFAFYTLIVFVCLLPAMNFMKRAHGSGCDVGMVIAMMQTFRITHGKKLCLSETEFKIALFFVQVTFCSN